MLNLVKSNRMEMLMQALASVTAQVPEDPMAPEWICIQSRGMKQWISVELARIHGICAHMTFLFPRDLIQYFLDRLPGPGGVQPDLQGIAPVPVLPDRSLDAFHLDKETLVWSVMAQLDPGTRSGPLALLDPYFQADDTGKKQVQLSQMLAAILDDYQVYRPDMLLGWEQGAGPVYPGNPEEAWQSCLWRQIAAAGQVPPMPGRMAALVRAAAAKQIPDLPSRISLFGLSAVPPSFMAFFSALDTDVFVFLLTPSNQFFFDIASPRQMNRLVLETSDRSGRKPSDLHWETLNPLLASLGRSGQQFHGLLEAGEYIEPFGDLFQDPAAGPGPVSMLCRLQSDILNLVFRHPDGEHPPVAVVPEDDAISIHACHSPMREAQVLKDLLMDTFERRPDIAPHDVIVMMPDIEAYAPYIEAVFSREHPLPFTISDRRHKMESPTIEAFLKILALKGSRLEQSRVMDLLLCPAIAEKFDIAPGDVQGLTEMVCQAGILWGIDPEHRRQLTGKGFAENTWQFGFQRLFMGIAMPETAQVLVNDAVLPCPFKEGPDAQILGKFARFCHTLFRYLDALEGKQTPARWESVFTGLVRDMIAADPSREPDIRFLFQMCQDMTREAFAGGFAGTLKFFAIQDLIKKKLDQAVAQGSFLAGGITFCNLMPMRSIPFRVVALMGMDETAFPRKIPVRSFDLISAHPCRGDKNLRDEDRYLFLETLLSARDRLIVTYTGMSVKDNSPVPCSGVVSELADVMNSTFVFPPGHRWWTTHRLHPFHPVYYDGTPGFFSYSSDHCSIARSRAGSVLSSDRAAKGTGQLGPGGDRPGPGRQKSPPGMPLPGGPLESDGVVAIPLVSLHRFFQRPLALFCNTFLEMAFPPLEPPLPDREPFQVSGLTRYQLGAGFLEKEPDPAHGTWDGGYPLARAGGLLPLGNQGRLEWEAIVRTACPIREMAQAQLPPAAVAPVILDLAVADTRIQGTVSDLFADDSGIVRCIKDFGLIHARRLLKNWITHLALSLAKPDTPVVTRIIGQDFWRRRPVGLWRFVPMGQTARPCLEALVSLYRCGQVRPLAFFPDTCFLLARALAENGYDLSEPSLLAAMKKAGSAWYNAHAGTGERTDRYAALWAAGRPDPFESPEQLAASGMVANALAVFKPLLAHLEDGP